MGKQHVVFFGSEPPALITPFADWPASGPKIAPGWWDNYNALKHDRFANRELATLHSAVQSIAGLLLAIIYSGHCDLALITASLLDTADHNPWAYSHKLRDVNWEGHAIIETKLFAHPIGVFGEEVTPSIYWDSDSPRFNAWWLLNGKSFRK